MQPILESITKEEIHCMATKKFEDLTFSDDFMFCKVLQKNQDLCKELLELVIGEPIGELVTVNKQHPVEITSDRRGVRFDVYSKDDASKVYDIEMQNAPKDHLPKRTRYIQGMMDLEELERGKPFSGLGKSYVIFICNFNIRPEYGRHRYLFKNLCADDPEIELGDETEKIFLCTEGTADDISDEMKEFLDYVAGKRKEGDFVSRLDSAVAELKFDPFVLKEYMDYREHMDDAREEGRAEGLEEGRAEERVNTEREKLRADAAEKELKRLKEELAAYKNIK